MTWELREVVEVSSDQVLEVSHVHFSGRDGIEFDDDGALLWTFRGGKAIRLKFFPSREKALEAVGLEDDESASSASRSARCCGRSTGRCCLRSTKAAWCSPTEGIDDIRAAFPDAAAMMADRPPSADKEFALALREFCEAI